jgi:NADP-dependent 3-hydroxy acid dehydrogenase YdfG
MDLAENVIVVTGAASGIGAAMARRFADEAPELLVLADVNTDGLAAVAASMPPGTQVWPVRLDVTAKRRCAPRRRRVRTGNCSTSTAERRRHRRRGRRR